MTSVSDSTGELTRAGRYMVLITAFLGWMFAGSVMVMIPLAGRPATISMGITDEKLVGQLFSWYICAFLLGAAAGGLLFGWLGDRIGRAKAMGLSILWYSVFTSLAFWVQTPWQLIGIRFVACLGVGGMWPNGVALTSEAWSNVSRPLMAGLIGTSANVGFMLLALVAMYIPIKPDAWRWVFALGAVPIPLGLAVFAFVPESPRWLARTQTTTSAPPRSPVMEVFRPPLLSVTLLGICLGMIPLLGNWGGANWLIPWTDQVGAAAAKAAGGEADPFLKSWTQWTRSGGAALGSLLGGWLASLFGRRTTYFVISLFSLATSAYLFRYITPLDEGFLTWVFLLGFFGTVYFGWLPLYLPELFPTRVRATGTGVTFNFGRVIAAFGVVGAGSLMLYFDGDYSKVGQTTSLIYLLGMVVICFAPDTSTRQLQD